MRFDLANLPSDIALLKALVRDMAAAVESRESEIERLHAIIKKLQRAQFGRRSERLDPDQFELALEDIESDISRVRERHPVPLAESEKALPKRTPLPDHLPRVEQLIDVDSPICRHCGSALHGIGESVSEMLDYVPARFRVLRITRPKYACRTCNSIAQAPAPERVLARGLATPALIAQVLTAKYCDHTPLYRQSQIYARHGMELDRSTLAGWVGGACWWLEALHERLMKDVLAADHLFADDTPVPVLDPGRGRTKTGRLWVYTRDQSGWGGEAPPAAVYLFEPDRKAERPIAHLERFKGVLMSMAMPASRSWRRATTSLWRPVGRTPGATSMKSPPAQDRRLPRRRCAGLATSMPSKRRCAASLRRIGWRRGDDDPGRLSSSCACGSMPNCHSFPSAPRSLTPSATR